MDMDKLMKMVSDSVSLEARNMCAKAGQMSLGELVARLESASRDKPILFSNGQHPGDYISYRGYYEFVSITTGKSETTVGEFLDKTKEAIGKTFKGYKGGDFTMTRHTPVWVADYGLSTSIGVCELAEQDEVVILMIKNIED